MYIYMCVCVRVCVYVYIYTHIHTYISKEQHPIQIIEKRCIHATMETPDRMWSMETPERMRGGEGVDFHSG